MNIMHVSFNDYSSLSEKTSTKKIWVELSAGAQQYHIVSRSNDQRFHCEQEGKLWLHRVPRLFGNKSFILSGWAACFIAKKYKIDIIISQCGLLGGIQAIVCKKLFKIPVMIEIHGNHYFEILRTKRSIMNKVLRWVYKNADIVRVLNYKMLDMLAECRVKGNFVEIPNRADFSVFSPPKTDFSISDPVHITSVGNFVHLKGYDFALKALSSDKPVQYSLTLIGGGELAEKYREIAKDSENVELILYDRLPQSEFVDILRQSDIYIQPSFSEAVPRATIEAMAMQIPVIASNAGMIEGLIHHRKNGLIFDKGDSTGFLKAIHDLVADEDYRRTLAIAAYADAYENYEWNRCFDRYRSVLYSLNDMR